MEKANPKDFQEETEVNINAIQVVNRPEPKNDVNYDHSADAPMSKSSRLLLSDRLRSHVLKKLDNLDETCQILLEKFSELEELLRQPKSLGVYNEEQMERGFPMDVRNLKTSGLRLSHALRRDNTDFNAGSIILVQPGGLKRYNDRKTSFYEYLSTVVIRTIIWEYPFFVCDRDYLNTAMKATGFESHVALTTENYGNEKSGNDDGQPKALTPDEMLMNVSAEATLLVYWFNKISGSLSEYMSQVDVRLDSVRQPMILNWTLQTSVAAFFASVAVSSIQLLYSFDVSSHTATATAFFWVASLTCSVFALLNGFICIFWGGSPRALATIDTGGYYSLEAPLTYIVVILGPILLLIASATSFIIGLSLFLFLNAPNAIAFPIVIFSGIVLFIFYTNVIHLMFDGLIEKELGTDGRAIGLFLMFVITPLVFIWVTTKSVLNPVIKPFISIGSYCWGCSFGRRLADVDQDDQERGGGGIGMAESGIGGNVNTLSALSSPGVQEKGGELKSS